MKMTAEQLQDHIVKTVLPLITEKVGTDIKAVVETQVNKSLEEAVKKEKAGPLAGIFEDHNPAKDAIDQQINAGVIAPGGVGRQNDHLGRKYSRCLLAFAKA